MKYAVVYQSGNNNARAVAEKIYNEIRSNSKVLVDVEKTSRIPDADMYIIGGSVHNDSCDFGVIRAIAGLSNAKIALFAVSSGPVSQKLARRVEDNLRIWVSAFSEYRGFRLFEPAGRNGISREVRDFLYEMTSEAFALA